MHSRRRSQPVRGRDDMHQSETHFKDDFLTFTTGQKYEFIPVFYNASEYDSFEFSVGADADFYIAFRNGLTLST